MGFDVPNDAHHFSDMRSFIYSVAFILSSLSLFAIVKCCAIALDKIIFSVLKKGLNN